MIALTAWPWTLPATSTSPTTATTASARWTPTASSPPWPATAPRLHRGRRPGHQRRALQSCRRGRGRLRQPLHRRHVQQSHPQGGHATASSPPWPATALAAYTGDGGPATSADSTIPMAWPWTPPATSTSPTTTTNRIRKVDRQRHHHHRGRQRVVQAITRRRRTGHQRRAESSLRRSGGRLRQPLHRRHWQQPHPQGGRRPASSPPWPATDGPRLLRRCGRPPGAVLN